MPKNLPANLIIEKNKLSTKSAWIVLLKITLNDSGSTELRFARNFEDVSFDDGGGSQTYTAFPFMIEPTEHSGKGEIPTVTLKVSNVTRLLEQYLYDIDGAVGSTVKVMVINTDNIAEDHSELDMTFDVLACHSTVEWVVFTLGAPNPLRQRFPLERYMALHCMFKYNDIEDEDGPKCGYAGKTVTAITKAVNAKISVTSHGFAVDDSIKFDDVVGMTEINGLTGIIQDADPDGDGNAFTVDIDSTGFTTYTSGGKCGYSTCTKTLADCRERSNSDRFGGFPGIRTGTVRFV